MNEELIYRKELLIRKNRCKEFYEKYIKKINSLFIDIEYIKFLSLEESDKIRKTIFENKAHTKRYDASNKNDLNNLMQNLKNCKGSYYVFIDHDWEYCGCFQVNSLEILREDFRFDNYITDDIVFIEKTFFSKTILDYYEMDNQFFIDYEVYKSFRPAELQIRQYGV
jgi:hypothetical protein